MPTKDAALRSLIGIVVDVRVIRICHLMYKSHSIFLVFYKVMSKANGDHLDVSLGLIIALRMVRRSGEVLNTKEGV